MLRSTLALVGLALLLLLGSGDAKDVHMASERKSEVVLASFNNQQYFTAVLVAADKLLVPSSLLHGFRQLPTEVFLGVENKHDLKSFEVEEWIRSDEEEEEKLRGLAIMKLAKPLDIAHVRIVEVATDLEGCFSDSSYMKAVYLTADDNGDIDIRKDIGVFNLVEAKFSSGGLHYGTLHLDRPKAEAGIFGAVVTNMAALLNERDELVGISVLHGAEHNPLVDEIHFTPVEEDLDLIFTNI